MSYSSVSSRRCFIESSSSPWLGSRIRAWRSASIVLASPIRLAVVTGAKWCLMRPAPLAFHGMISQSRHAQSVLSVFHSPAASKAARNRLRTAVSRPGSSKKRRPVRVYTHPGLPSLVPNRWRAVSSSRVTTTMPRDPMCLSWQTTVLTPRFR